MKICIECGEYMYHGKKFGDGYHEPYEQIYHCSCGVKCISHQLYEDEWCDEKGEEIEL